MDSKLISLLIDHQSFSAKCRQETTFPKNCFYGRYLNSILVTDVNGCLYDLFHISKSESTKIVCRDTGRDKNSIEMKDLPKYIGYA